MTSPSPVELWTIRATLNWMTNRFKTVGSPTALLDAQLLLVKVLEIPKIKLYTDLDRPLSGDERGVLRELVKRRIAGEPIAYLTNQKVWHDLDLFVDRRVLIPRPETETLLDFVLGYLKDSETSPSLIFDFCTGSGCLAIALAKRFPQALIVAIDISHDALDVAKINAERNRASNIEFILADVTQNACYDALVKFGTPDVIVANPPYISLEEWQTLDIEVRDFEPKISLAADAGELAVAQGLLHYLNKSDWLTNLKCLALEVAEGHPRQLYPEIVSTLSFPAMLSAMPEKTFFAMQDLEGRERFVCRIASASCASNFNDRSDLHCSTNEVVNSDSDE